MDSAVPGGPTVGRPLDAIRSRCRRAHRSACRKTCRVRRPARVEPRQPVFGPQRLLLEPDGGAAAGVGRRLAREGWPRVAAPGWGWRSRGLGGPRGGGGWRGGFLAGGPFGGR